MAWDRFASSLRSLFRASRSCPIPQQPSPARRPTWRLRVNVATTAIVNAASVARERRLATATAWLSQCQTSANRTAIACRVRAVCAFEASASCRTPTPTASQSAVEADAACACPAWGAKSPSASRAAETRIARGGCVVLERQWGAVDFGSSPLNARPTTIARIVIRPLCAFVSNALVPISRCARSRVVRTVCSASLASAASRPHGSRARRLRSVLRPKRARMGDALRG